MEVPSSDYGDDEWGDYDSEPEEAPALPKRRKSKKRSGKKSRSATPGVGKRIFAVIGMVFGVVITLAGAWALFSGNMRGARGIGSGIVMFAVSLGWFKGTSD